MLLIRKFSKIVKRKLESVYKFVFRFKEIFLVVVSECVLGLAAIRASQDAPNVTLRRENIPAVAHLLLQTG